MRRTTRLGLLLVAVAVVVVAIVAAAQLTSPFSTRTAGSRHRDEVTRAVVVRHDQAGVFRLHRFARADRALKHVIDAWWAVPFVLAALVGAWVLRSSRRAGRFTRTVVAFRRRGPPLLPLVV